MERTTRERLTGAVIFVAVVSIIAPEMFSGSGEDAVAHDQVTPAETGPPLATYELAISPPGSAAAAPVQPAATAAEAPVLPQAPPPAPDETSVPAAAQAAQPVARAAPAPVEPPPPADTRAGGDWWVQLGSFSSEQNAQRLARDLRARGFTIEVAKVRAAGQDMHRVRAGPVRDRDAATALKTRLGASARDAKLVGP